MGTRGLVISTEWVAAGAAVLAAVVGPLISVYIGGRQNKTAAAIARQQINASLVSASRQTWVDNLRNAIAEFQAIQYNLGFRGGHSYELGSEEDHEKLLIQMDKALSIAYAAGSEARREMVVTQTAITEIAQRLLKREWERIKAGERDRGN